MSQFNFNMMDAAGYGFYRVWIERSYLLKLAAIPFFIKFACTVAVMALGLENNILRQGLILFPGVLAEGWVLAQFLRTLLKNERWPTLLPENIDEKILEKLLLRARGIVAATLAFALISLVSYLIHYISLVTIMGDANPSLDMVVGDKTQPQKLNIDPMMMIPLLGGVIGLFWAFRLMWIYIPLSVLMPIQDYLRAVKGMMSSAKMIVLFLCTMTPVLFVTIMTSRLVFNAFGDAGDDIARFIMLFVAVISEIVVGLAATAAFVYAMKDFLPKNTDLLKDMPKPGDKK